MTYQFRRGLGETQEGGGTVSECFLAAGAWSPATRRAGTASGWRSPIATSTRGEEETRKGHVQHRDELLAARRRLLSPGGVLPRCPTTRAGSTPSPHGEVEPELPRATQAAGRGAGDPVRGRQDALRLLRARALRRGRQPCLISMGGLDSIKDEMWFMQAHGALQRGISVLMIDGPGQGGTLRRHRIPTAPTTRCRSAAASTTPDAQRRRPVAHRGLRLEPRRLLRGARRLRRSTAWPPHLARRAVEDPRAVGERDEDHGLAATSSGCSG